MTKTAKLASNNETWGFWGTIRHHANPAEAWPIAMQAIGETTGCSDVGVRDFLDSRHGRHFADDVANGLFKGLPLPQAIEAAVERWMTWTINQRTARETGIRADCPTWSASSPTARSWPKRPRSDRKEHRHGRLDWTHSRGDSRPRRRGAGAGAAKIPRE